MEEYNAELDRRIDERKKAVGKKRKRIVSAVIALVLCAGVGAGTAAHLAGNRSGNIKIDQTVYSLPVDGKDKYTAGSGRYTYKPEYASKESDRMSYSGLLVCRGEDGKTYFTLLENGAIYTVDNGSVGYILGAANAGMFLGASCKDGRIYMPSVKEILCGAFSYYGVCRLNIATGETECLVTSSGRIGPVLALEKMLVYAAMSDDKVIIRLCDLETGRIYRLAEFIRPAEGEPDHTVKICPVGDRLAVLCWGSVYTVTFGGEKTLIAEHAEQLSAEEERIYVFGGVRHAWEASVSFMGQTAQTVTIYSPDGDEIGVFDASAYMLCSDVSGFPVYNGKLPAVKDGAVLLVDPLNGKEEKLFDSASSLVYAAISDGELIIVDELGYDTESWDYTGRVTVVSQSGAEHVGSLPKDLNYSEPETLYYPDIDSAKEAHLYDPSVKLPFDLDKIEIICISGWGSHVYSHRFGDRHEIVSGRVEIDARYRGKCFSIVIEQEPPDGGSGSILSLAAAVGLGEHVEQGVLAADELPYAVPCGSDGTLYYDLIGDPEDPCGIMTWFEYADGSFADIDARIRLRNGSSNTIVYIQSDEVTSTDIKDILSFD